MLQILIINGPNLNLLGSRLPEVYGTQSFDNYFKDLQIRYATLAELSYRQSNHEGDLIDWIQAADRTVQAVILNAGGYTHTSIALRDAVEAVSVPIVEVHISDIRTREPFRQHSFLTEVCAHSVIGQGLSGYELALRHILEREPQL